MITIKELAKQLNVAVSTVSMALRDDPRINIDTRNKVQQKAQELGYVRNGLAIDLQRRKTDVILLIVTDASRSYYSNVIRSAQNEVSKHGYNLVIITTVGSNQAAKKFISEHRADGAIIFTNRIEDDFIKRYASEKFPILILGNYIDHEHIYNIHKNWEYDLSSHVALEYLYSKGKRKIGFVKGSSSTRGTPRRLKSYKMFLKEKNLSYNPNLVFDAKLNTYEAGIEVTKLIQHQIKKLDSLLFSNDDIALGALKGFKDLNINVPDELSIMGINNLAESKLVHPALTTVDTNLSELLEYGIDNLIDAIENGKPKNKDLLERENLAFVIERETVK